MLSNSSARKIEEEKKNRKHRTPDGETDIERLGEKAITEEDPEKVKFERKTKLPTTTPTPTPTTTLPLPSEAPQNRN